MRLVLLGTLLALPCCGADTCANAPPAQNGATCTDSAWLSHLWVDLFFPLLFTEPNRTVYGDPVVLPPPAPPCMPTPRPPRYQLPPPVCGEPKRYPTFIGPPQGGRAPVEGP